MADNLAQFEVRFRRYIRESSAATSFWNQNMFQQMFNAQYRRRCAQLIMAYEGWFTLTANRDVEADKDTYGFPDGLQRLLKIEIVRSDGSRVPLQRWERHDEINRASNSSSSGDAYLPNYRPFGNGFILEPTPTETVTNGLRIEYSGIPAFLSSAGDKLHPSFPEILDELIVLDTVVLALESEGVHEMGPTAAIYKTRADFEFDFERFIETRVVSRDFIDPFIPAYSDS